MPEKLRQWFTPSVLIQAVVAVASIAGLWAVSQWRLDEMSRAQEAMATAQSEMRQESREQVEKLTAAVGGLREGQIRSDAEFAATLKALGDRLALVEADGKTQVQVNARIMADLARLGR